MDTDDPALFGLDLRGEYGKAREALELSEAEEIRMQTCALAASFANPEIRTLVGAELGGRQ
ncbi:MAG: hypothetical protein IPM94_07425 [bacterium]|nr:hypothetical protein [bacterium]